MNVIFSQGDKEARMLVKESVLVVAVHMSLCIVMTVRDTQATQLEESK